MKDSRPVFLDLTAIKLPVAGFMSIVHRITGVLLFLAIPVLISLMQDVLGSEQSFAQAQQIMNSIWGQLGLLLALWALAHHLLAGMRYLFLDMQLGIQAPHYQRSALLVLLAAPVLALLLAWGLLS